MKVLTELAVNFFLQIDRKLTMNIYCAGLKALSGCSNLSNLKIGICLRISDEGLTHIGKFCPQLRDVDLYRSLLDMPCGFLSLVLFRIN
jgi:hypothetical protein